MSVGSITGITIVVALLGVLVVGLLSYMSSLVRRAYELKVELHGEMDRGLRQIETDMDLRAKHARRDLQEEMGKLRETLKTEGERRHEDLIASVDATLDAWRAEQVKVQTANTQAVEELRQRHRVLQQELSAVNAELRRLGGGSLSGGNGNGGGGSGSSTGVL